MIKYSEFSGRVEFTYEEKVDANMSRIVHEEIPDNIVAQGKDAIKDYAFAKVRSAKVRWQKHDAYEQSIRENPIPIRTRYKDGTELEGFITDATVRGIGVRLTSPFEAESGIAFGWASAMGKRYVFDGDKISKAGYDAAETALRWAYERVLNKPVTDLVAELNKK